MKSNEKDILLLDQYIKGQLEGEQKIDLEQRLIEESDLANDYEFIKKVAADARIAKLNQVMTSIKSMEIEHQQKPEVKTVNKGKKWIKYFRAAVIIGLMFYFGSKYLSNSKPKYPPQYAEMMEQKFDQELILHETFRAANQVDQLTKEQRRAYELYSIKEFKLAIPLLEKLWTNNKDTLAYFYLGVSKIGIGEVAKGEEILKSQALKEYPNIIK